MRKVVQSVLFTGLSLLATNNFAAEPDYEKIYKKQCATCHGNKGDGKGRAGASFATRPTNFTSEKSRQSLSFERIKKAIRDGVPGSPMVGYGRRFDEKTLDGLADFIQVRFMGKKSSVNTAQPFSTDTDNGEGKKLYAEHCSACHGDKGESAVWAKNGLKPPPRNFTTEKAREELSRERMIMSVTHGRPGTAMMSFASRLSAEQIAQVVGYIRQNFMKETTGSHAAPSIPARPAHGGHVNRVPTSESAAFSHAMVDMNALFPSKLSGDVEKGKTFYNDNCFSCHGIKGDGKGPRAHFNYPRPRDFTTEESGVIFNRPRLFKAISTGKRGSVMPAWSTVLSEQEIANVAEYVFQQFIQNKSSELKKKP